MTQTPGGTSPRSQRVMSPRHTSLYLNIDEQQDLSELKLLPGVRIVVPDNQKPVSRKQKDFIEHIDPHDLVRKVEGIAMLDLEVAMLQLQRKCVVVLNNLACLYASQGRTLEAKKCLEQILKDVTATIGPRLDQISSRLQLSVIWNLKDGGNCQITCIMWTEDDQWKDQFHIMIKGIKIIPSNILSSIEIKDLTDSIDPHHPPDPAKMRERAIPQLQWQSVAVLNNLACLYALSKRNEEAKKAWKYALQAWKEIEKARQDIQRWIILDKIYQMDDIWAQASKEWKEALEKWNQKANTSSPRPTVKQAEQEMQKIQALQVAQLKAEQVTKAPLEAEYDVQGIIKANQIILKKVEDDNTRQQQYWGKIGGRP